MEGKLEIVGLYEYDDEYQVIDSNRTVWFQGRKSDCKKYIKKTNKGYGGSTKIHLWSWRWDV